MKTIKITLSLIGMLVFLNLNEAMGQSWWAKVGTTNNIINTNSGSVYIGQVPTPPPSTISLLEVAKLTTEPTITVRNLGGTGGAAFRMCDKSNGAEWKFKLAYPTGDFKIRDHKYGRDVFTIETNSPHLFMYIKAAGNLGIGTPSPNNSALVDMTSTSKGFLPPRMTASQRTGIGSPAAGLLVFQTDAPSGYYYYTGTSWKALAGDSPAHYIGELFGGGIVVAVWKEAGVEHGLIASLTDISQASAWSNITATAIGATAQSPTDGLANTIAIINQPGHVTSAAKLCVDHHGGGFYDWYLPSAWELNQCFNAAFIVNTILGATDGFQFSYAVSAYWSSTEAESYNNSAWALSFMEGRANPYPKFEDFYGVRAVRKF